ncbi:MAG: transcriptional regulator, partial [Actinomycetales bacterium]|nr:transcriptional regulator [Actinomycetales bacterium]
TSNPEWYVRQLAAVRHPFRVVGGPEVRAAARDLAARLAAAVGDFTS